MDNKLITKLIFLFFTIIDLLISIIGKCRFLIQSLISCQILIKNNMSKPISVNVSPTTKIYLSNKSPQFQFIDYKESKSSQSTASDANKSSRQKSPFFWKDRSSPVSHKKTDNLRGTTGKNPQQAPKERRQSHSTNKISNVDSQKNISVHKNDIPYLEKNKEDSSEIKILICQLQRQKKEKSYWKHYALKLQEEGKGLKTKDRILRNQKTVQEVDSMKNYQSSIQKLMNEKLDIQKQMLKFQNENKQLIKKVHEFEKNQKILKQQISNNVNKNCQKVPQVQFINGNTQKTVFQQKSQSHHSCRRQIESLKLFVGTQQQVIQNLNQQITKSKMKLLQLKYIE